MVPCVVMRYRDQFTPSEVARITVWAIVAAVITATMITLVRHYALAPLGQPELRWHAPASSPPI